MKITFCISLLLALALAEPPVPSNRYLPSNRNGANSREYLPPSLQFRNGNANNGGISSRYGPPAQQYGPPAQQYGPPAQRQAPSQQYGAPQQQYGPPSQQYGAPQQRQGLSQQYGAPARSGNGKQLNGGVSSRYGAPSQQYGAPNGGISAPASRYGAPSQIGAPSQQYGAPSQQYGAPSQQYGAPSEQYGAPSQQYGAPNGGGYSRNGNGYDDQSEPASYQFNYMVQDAESGSDFGHEEQREGDVAQGRYFVLLPDGRRQTVDYTADTDGFHPMINYQDEGVQGGYPGRGNGRNGGYSNGGYSSRGAEYSNGNGYPSGNEGYNY